MNQKQIGMILIVIGLLVAILTYGIKARDDNFIDKLIENQGGSCYLEDGTCLHEDRSLAPYTAGYILSASLIILGLYLIFFEKTQEKLARQQKEISTALKEAKIQNIEKDKFEAFLAGFDADKQLILKAIHEQDGIQQSTLRYRTGISKSTLSLQLKELEEKDIIKRKPEGKTNKVFLRKKF